MNAPNSALAGLQLDIQSSERAAVLNRVLANRKPWERQLAYRIFMRNYVRPGSTALGCEEYVEAVFSVPLKREDAKPWWAPISQPPKKLPAIQLPGQRFK